MAYILMNEQKCFLPEIYNPLWEIRNVSVMQPVNSQG